MFKVVIVDDELLVQIGIQSMIEWEKEDMSIAGLCSNGEQAYELIQKENPQIVITDIRMPVVDGLELIRRCRESMEIPPQFILLTSHEEFAYAREAISLDAVAYLVKLDLSPEGLTAALNEAKERSRKIHSLILEEGEQHPSRNEMERLFKQIINNLVDRADIRNSVKAIDPQITDHLFLLGFDVRMKNKVNLTKSEEERIYRCVENMAYEIMKKEYYSYEIPINLDRFMILACTENVPNPNIIKINMSKVLDRILRVVGEYFNVELKAGCSSFLYGLEDIMAACSEVRQALRHMDEHRPVMFFDDIEEEKRIKRAVDITVFSKDILRAFREQDTGRMQSVFTDLKLLIEELQMETEQLQDLCNKLLYFILTAVEEGEEIIAAAVTGEESGFTHISRLAGKEDAVRWLGEVRDAVLLRMEQMDGDYSQRLVRMTKSYIEERREGKILLTECADMLQVNPSYLSMIFKKYSQLSFSEYVTKVKMEYAMKLLAGSNFKIYEVADRAGYENAYYFSKVFKKFTGMTPKEYVRRKS